MEPADYASILLRVSANPSRGNMYEHLVLQYRKRASNNRILGTEEEPVAWESLGLDQKVQILWQLCEWQLDDPARFRSLLTSESDAPSWVCFPQRCR